MAAPYDNGAGYVPDPLDRAPSPYHPQASSNSYYAEHPQQYDAVVQIHQQSPYSEGPTPASETGESDRGILGALGGGGVGGYVGRQHCHGVLGTLGGAIIGSLTEDWARKKKPLCGSRPQSCHNSRPCSPQPPPAGPICDPGHNPCNTGNSGPYSPPYVDSHTTVNTSTHVQPGYYPTHQPSHPVNPPSYHHNQPAPGKPCGHAHPCGCHIFGHHKY